MNMKLPCILLGAIAATITSAQAAQTLGYDFDLMSPGSLLDGASIPNSGSVGGPGTFHVGSLGGSGAIVNTGPVSTAYGMVDLLNTLTLTPLGDGNTNLEAPYIDANAAVSSFGFAPNQTYSAFAWVNIPMLTNDNMVFGGNGALGGGEVLHLGTRQSATNNANNVQSGHWGDDAGPDQGLLIPVPDNEWHVIAFTNDGTTGTQTIYLDPGSATESVLSGGDGTGGAMQTAINLLIGTANNGGSFIGQMDRVTAYDTLQTPAELGAAATVPEPATFVALASGAGLLLMGRRRRRSS